MLQAGKIRACEFCSAKFHTQEMLNIHKRLHANHSFMCAVCKAVFSTMASMTVHLWKAHAISKSEQGKNTVSLDWAADSFAPPAQSMHAAYFRCCKCNKSFKHEFSILRHLKTHRKLRLSAVNSVQTIESTQLTPNDSLNDPESIQNHDDDPEALNSLKQNESMTLDLSVDDKGPVTYHGKVQLDNPAPRLGRSRLSQRKYECGWCGASFKFNFSHEAHMKHHKLMGEHNI